MNAHECLKRAVECARLGRSHKRSRPEAVFDQARLVLDASNHHSGSEFNACPSTVPSGDGSRHFEDFFY